MSSSRECLESRGKFKFGVQIFHRNCKLLRYCFMLHASISQRPTAQATKLSKSANNGRSHNFVITLLPQSACHGSRNTHARSGGG